MRHEELLTEISQYPSLRLAKAYLDIQQEYAKLVGRLLNLKEQIRNGSGPLQTCQEITRISEESQRDIGLIVDDLTKSIQ